MVARRTDNKHLAETRGEVGQLVVVQQAVGHDQVCTGQKWSQHEAVQRLRKGVALVVVGTFRKGGRLFDQVVGPSMMSRSTGRPVRAPLMPAA